MDDRTMDYIRLLNNAMKAYENSKSEWAQNYWLGVCQKLMQNIEKKELH
jgi:hypothetical protein